jgi:tRNA (mo5U34)-methyltransferase
VANERIRATRHGDWFKWWQAINQLPEAPQELPADWRQRLGRPVPRVLVSDLPDLRALLFAAESPLRELMPWRKGPFEIAGQVLDAEWRCDLKWQRLASHIDFTDRRVIDVGSGNGYYCLRALGVGARCALGIDPTWLYALQFLALRRMLGAIPAAVLPLTLEDLPAAFEESELVLSMGVLYHRREPAEHLRALRQLMSPGAALVLETLIVDAAGEEVLVPRERYAGMRNVWAVPSPRMVDRWLLQAGFREPRLVDLTTTTSDEQCASGWSFEHSLEDVLDAEDPTRTIEGYPAPRRGIWIAFH